MVDQDLNFNNSDPEYEQLKQELLTLLEENQKLEASLKAPVVGERPALGFDPSALLTARLERFIDFVLPERDPTTIHARLAFEISWQKFIQDQFKKADQQAREQFKEAISRRGSNLVVPNIQDIENLRRRGRN